MTIQFQHYSESNRVPGNFIEVNASRANSSVQNLRTLIIGQMLGTGTYVPNMPIIAENLDTVKAKAGFGSNLAIMVDAYRKRDSVGELWVLPLLDDPAAIAATGTLTFVGTATASGVISVYLGGKRVYLSVYATNAPVDMATSLVSIVNAAADLSVTATSALGVVTFTAKNKGTTGNDIDIRIAYRGPLGGEVLPAGITYTIAPMAGGAAVPSLTAGLLALGDMALEVYAFPYTDSASLDALKAFFDDNTGRWAWSRMLYGHAYAARKGTLGLSTTFGTARNDQHVSVMPFDNSPTPAWQAAAEIAAAVAESVRADPALPLSDVPVFTQPPTQDRWFGFAARGVLLYDGLSTYKVDQSNQMFLERMVTTYQVNAAGAPDNSYLDAETMHTLGYVCRDLHFFLASQFSRKKLVNDVTRIVGSSNVVSPAVIKASVISRYVYLERQLVLVQDSPGFAAGVVVENAGGGVVKILAPLVLVNQLRVTAVLCAFVKP
ncbi:MAG: phage tail sheath subtilisin-like domain-containing protein [Bradyrhizobium sp.]